MAAEEPATHTANVTVEEDVMSKPELVCEMAVSHDADDAIFNLNRDLRLDSDDTNMSLSDTCLVLLQSLSRGADGYWLVDSGASVCVVTPHELKRFKHTPVRSLNRPMQAANGSDVMIGGFSRVWLQSRLVILREI